MKLEKILLILFLNMNVWPLTLSELIRLEDDLGNAPIVSTAFFECCYELVAKEENPRHIKFLSNLLDTAQGKDREEVYTLLKYYENLLKSEG